MFPENKSRRATIRRTSMQAEKRGFVRCSEINRKGELELKRLDNSGGRRLNAISSQRLKRIMETIAPRKTRIKGRRDGLEGKEEKNPFGKRGHEEGCLRR